MKTNISFRGQELPVGLDIGANQIRAVQLKHVGGELVLHDFGVVALKPGTTHEGEILDPAAVADALRELWGKCNFTGKVVAAGVANQQIIFRMIEFPWTEPKKLREAILLQAQDLIPIPIEDAMIDFAITGEKVNEDGERVYEIMLAAIERSNIDTIVDSIVAAGLKPARIDLTALALVRSVLGDDNSFRGGSDFFDSEETVAILHISSGMANLAVVEKGSPRFVRFIATGGDDFTLAIAKELDLSFDDAEKLKRELALPSFDGSVTPTDEYDDQTVVKAQTVLELEVGKLINELRLSFDFYTSQSPHRATVKKIYATGSTMHLAHLPEYLETGLSAPVEIVDPFESITIPSNLQNQPGDDRYSYAPAIGLAIGGR